MASIWTSAVSGGLAQGWEFIVDAAPVLGVLLIFFCAGLIVSGLRRG